MAAPDELPEGIRSERARDRRDAVHELGDLNPRQRAELRALRSSEPDIWVRKGMDRHLGSAPPQNATAEEPDAPVDPETAKEIREQARGEIAELVVHELRHSLTHIELAAEREIDDFASSQTKRALDGFRSIARSLSQLADAAKGAQVVEVSLPDVIVEATLDFAQSLWPPDLQGPPDVVVRADPDLIRLALSNCVRNAIDASAASFHHPKPVLITWGRTDRDAWIAVHDDGIGLPAQISQLFEAHHTTKGGAGHAGLGLTIARNALATMGGEILLGPRQPRGAICELRWPQVAG
jgi:signal transduction histidine kinase